MVVIAMPDRTVIRNGLVESPTVAHAYARGDLQTLPETIDTLFDNRVELPIITSSEEHLCMNTDPKFGPLGQPLYIAIHGDGIITPDMLWQAQANASMNIAMQPFYTSRLLKHLARGYLPSAQKVPIYTEENLHTLTNETRYAVILPMDLAFEPSGPLRPLENHMFLRARTGLHIEDTTTLHVAQVSLTEIGTSAVMTCSLVGRTLMIGPAIMQYKGNYFSR